MKFRNTTLSSIEQKKIPTDDSVIVTTDASLVSYCADDVLHKVNRPDWKSIDLPAPGKLVSNGMLNPLYASTLQFGSNDSAGTCRAYQEAGAYRLSTTKFQESVWIRWMINFDEVDYIDVKWKTISGSTGLLFTVTDSEYDPLVASFSSYYYDKNVIFRETMPNERTIHVSQYVSGIHWMYIHTSFPQGSCDLFELELRK